MIKNNGRSLETVEKSKNLDEEESDSGKAQDTKSSKKPIITSLTEIVTIVILLHFVLKTILMPVAEHSFMMKAMSKMFMVRTYD